jgi:hypothetical protein
VRFFFFGRVSFGKILGKKNAGKRGGIQSARKNKNKVGKTLPRKPVHNPRQGGGKRKKVRTEKRENRRKDEVTWRANAAHSVCHEEKEQGKKEKRPSNTAC